MGTFVTFVGGELVAIGCMNLPLNIEAYFVESDVMDKNLDPAKTSVLSFVTSSFSISSSSQATRKGSIPSGNHIGTSTI